MSKKKTIFDLYRENDENFSAQPSSKAWEKLQNQLDERDGVAGHSGGRLIRMNWLSIAAGMLILVGAVSFFFLSKNMIHSPTASAEKTNGFMVEDLVLTDSDKDFRSEWRVANDYRARFVGNYAVAEKDENQAKLRPRKINQSPDEQLALNDEPKHQISKELSDRIQEDLTAKEDFVNKDSDAIIAENQTLSDVAHESNGNNTEVPAGYVSADKFFTKKSKSAAIGIQKFNWLIGNWSEESTNVKAIENWVADSANTIVGTGYLVQGDDTVFTEKPSLKQIGDKIYLFKNLDKNVYPVRHELMVEADSQWIFENRNPSINSRVILTRGVNNYLFETKNNIAPNIPRPESTSDYSTQPAARNMIRMN